MGNGGRICAMHVACMYILDEYKYPTTTKKNLTRIINPTRTRTHIHTYTTHTTRTRRLQIPEHHRRRRPLPRRPSQLLHHGPHLPQGHRHLHHRPPTSRSRGCSTNPLTQPPQPLLRLFQRLTQRLVPAARALEQGVHAVQHGRGAGLEVEEEERV